MAIVNGENLKAISAGFRKEFQDSYAKVEVLYPKIATEIRVNTLSVTYAWLSDFPKMSEWIGNRAIKDLEAHTYTIAKKRFEASIGVDKDYIVYDSLGVVKPRIQQMAHDGKTHYDELVFPLLEANGVCYDKLPFFSAKHEIGSSKVSNLGDLQLTQENFLATRAKMMNLKGDSGKSLKIKPNLIVVPSALEATALTLFKADLVDGSTNITKGMVEILVSNDLTDEKAWYLLDTTRPLKPLILQINKPIEFTAMDNPNDESVFMRAEFRYGIDSEDNAGYGLWQLAYKQTGTATPPAPTTTTTENNG